MRKVDRIEVLVATMNQVDKYNLPEYMNIQSDAIIGNQCDRNEIVEVLHKGHNIKWLNFAERGVGRNRNNALMRSTADVVLFADDDMYFDDGYPDVVKRLFNEFEDADIIIFNLKGSDGRKRRLTTKAHFTSKTFFGAARIAARRDKLFKNNLFFNLCFGGGTEYSCGEDSLFLTNCKNAGLKILLVPDSIATLEGGRESTWYQGETDKLYMDRGALFAATRISFPYVRMILYSLKAAIRGKRKFYETLRLYYTGYKSYKNR